MSDGAQQPSRDALAERFFGPAAGLGGPFALLGVTHACGDASDLARAVERRLAQLGRHRLALTPEADEVRLSLYAAAAQLGDPTLRDECAKIWPPGEPHAMPAAWRAHLAEVSPALIRKARHIIGVSGGWNGRAKKRLAMMARAQRVSALDLVKALRPSGGRKQPGVPPVRGAVPEMREPRMSGRDWFLVHGSLSLMLLLMVTLIAKEVINPPTPPVTEIVRDTNPAGRSGIGSRGVVPPEREDVQHYAALEQELGNAVRAASDDPSAAGRRVARVVSRFLERWTDAPSDARGRIAEALNRFADEHRGSPDALHPVLAAIDSGRRLDAPTAYAASVALGNRIAPSLDAGDPVQAAFAEETPVVSNPGSPDGFDGLLLGALGSLARIVVNPGADWWEAWATGVERCDGVPISRREAVLLGALGRGLVGSGVGWRESARSLAGRVVWRSGSPARAWLLERFTDRRVPSDRLAILTRVLATEVSVPGVDLTMVLAPDADAAARADLAGRYRSVWLAERPPPSEAQAVTLDAIKSAVDFASRIGDGPERLVAIEGLVRANAAAGLLFAGDETAPDRLLITASESPPPGVAPASNQRLDTDWAVRLIRAETEQGVMRVLGEAGGRGVGAQAAEALVTIAFSGPGRRVRERAREMLRVRGDSVTVLLAMERAIGGRPTSAELGLVADLLGWPGDGDIDPDEARSALLLRAAEQSLAERPGQTGLQIEDLLAERAGLPPGSPSAISLGALVERWSASGETLGGRSVGSTERTLGAMLGVSGSAGQVQAAYHRALVDLIGVGLVARGAVGGAWAERIIERMGAAWSAGETATDQMLASQLAEARLWELVLEGTP